MIGASARDSWRELDATLRPFVARRVRSSADVDDVVQNVLLRIQRGLADLRDDQRFGPWVYQVARSSIADYQRASRRHPAGNVEPAAEEAPPIANDDPTAERELAGHVAMFVAMLPSPYREALTLTELEAVSQKDAASILAISPSGMRSRVQRGRRRLRDTLYACCNIGLDARGRVVSCEPRPDGRLPGCRCR